MHTLKVSAGEKVLTDLLYITLQLSVDPMTAMRRVVLRTESSSDTVFSLRQVNRRVKEQLDFAIGAAYDITCPLSRFVEAVPFRCLQASVGFLVSGNFAYEFLARGRNAVPISMDIYVVEAHVPAVANFLIDSGYAVETSRRSFAAYWPVHATVAGFLHGDVYDRTSSGHWIFRRQDVNGTRYVNLFAAREVELLCVLNASASKSRFLL